VLDPFSSQFSEVCRKIPKFAAMAVKDFGAKRYGAWPLLGFVLVNLQAAHFIKSGRG
jgi:hypothetical protein